MLLIKTGEMLHWPPAVWSFLYMKLCHLISLSPSCEFVQFLSGQHVNVILTKDWFERVKHQVLWSHKTPAFCSYPPGVYLEHISYIMSEKKISSLGSADIPLHLLFVFIFFISPVSSSVLFPLLCIFRIFLPFGLGWYFFLIFYRHFFFLVLLISSQCCLTSKT